MRYFMFLLSTVILIVMSSCATNQLPDRKEKNADLDNGYVMVDGSDQVKLGAVSRPNEDRPSNRTLADMIGELAGVDMAGRGNNISFKVRGAASFFSGSDPLFVLNGNSVGSDFSSLVNVVDPNTVSSLRVLKGSDASIYGSRGANGVILIRTKEM